MVVRHLGNTDFEIIMDCFLSAFENYFVKMPKDHNFYKERWTAAGVRFDLSYGMFDNEILVGFILHAIDERQGELTAYNSGTGVIPEYRGRRIVKSIYNFGIPDLVKNGITKCVLEVITENVKAIKSYEGIGFRIEKNYRCYSGSIQTDNEAKFTLKDVSFHAVNWHKIPNQTFYSWDNQTRSLEKGNYKYFEVHDDHTMASLFIINPESGYLAQFEVIEKKEASWKTLFSAIQSQRETVRINNIDHRLTAKIEAVESYGLKNTVDQYEMELKINPQTVAERIRG